LDAIISPPFYPYRVPTLSSFQSFPHCAVSLHLCSLSEPTILFLHIVYLLGQPRSNLFSFLARSQALYPPPTSNEEIYFFPVHYPGIATNFCFSLPSHSYQISFVPPLRSINVASLSMFPHDSILAFVFVSSPFPFFLPSFLLASLPLCLVRQVSRNFSSELHISGLFRV